jgi:hypothetical protein
VIVRAPGLAPAILNLESTGAHMERTVSLTPGRLIELSVRKVDGRAIPKDVVPSVVYSESADRVRPMRMPENIRPGRVIDFEVSKVHRVGEGRFRFRVPDETPPFFLAIDHPGFMRTIETEMISESELADGRIEWQLPASARLRVRFDFPAAGDHPRYDCSSVLVATHIPDVAKYYTVWLQKQSDNLSFDATLDDLPPNDYKLILWLAPPEHEGVSRPGDATRLFRDSVEFSLIAGEEKTIDLDYAAYDPDSWRGSTTATVTVKNYGGKPAARSSYMLTYVVPHYYAIVLEGGYLDAAGRFQLEGVRPGPDGPVFYLKVGLLIMLLVPVCYREVNSLVIYTYISQRGIVVKGAGVFLLKALGCNRSIYVARIVHYYIRIRGINCSIKVVAVLKFYSLTTVKTVYFEFLRVLSLIVDGD